MSISRSTQGAIIYCVLKIIANLDSPIILNRLVSLHKVSMRWDKYFKILIFLLTPGNRILAYRDKVSKSFKNLNLELCQKSSDNAQIFRINEFLGIL